MGEIILRYTNEKTITLPEYEATQNPELKGETEELVVRAAFQNLPTSSTPGTDGVTNKMLSNVDEKYIPAMRKYFNEC